MDNMDRIEGNYDANQTIKFLRNFRSGVTQQFYKEKKYKENLYPVRRRSWTTCLSCCPSWFWASVFSSLHSTCSLPVTSI